MENKIRNALVIAKIAHVNIELQPSELEFLFTQLDNARQAADELLCIIEEHPVLRAHATRVGHAVELLRGNRGSQAH